MGTGSSRNEEPIDKCIQRLLQHTHNKNLLFILVQGTYLASRSMGGAHKNSDDPDLDIFAVTDLPGVTDSLLLNESLCAMFDQV